MIASDHFMNEGLTSSKEVGAGILGLSRWSWDHMLIFSFIAVLVPPETNSFLLLQMMMWSQVTLSSLASRTTWPGWPTRFWSSWPALLPYPVKMTRREWPGYENNNANFWTIRLRHLSCHQHLGCDAWTMTANEDEWWLWESTAHFCDLSQSGIIIRNASIIFDRFKRILPFQHSGCALYLWKHMISMTFRLDLKWILTTL